ncbi:MAG: YigZ family protein [Synergistaceae bacterium]|nr:YigZ family protein [Synergistaceae bacterium]
MNAYLEPSQPVTYEEKIKRSVFIANVEVCHNEDEAKNFLNRITSEHHNATHNCRAYIIGETEYSSDDGEPSGTAGRPILNAIKRSGLVNVMVIVTRYYGGVKLGVRGLIDAYGGVAEKALSMAGSAERVITCEFAVSLEYGSMGIISKLLDAYNPSWQYGEAVNVTASVPIDDEEKITRELEELKARKIITYWEKKS